METDGGGKEGIHVKSKDEKEMMPQILDRLRRGTRLKCDDSLLPQHSTMGKGGNSQGNSEVRRFRKLGASLAV